MMNIKKIITTFVIALVASAFYDHMPWQVFLTAPLFSVNGMLITLFSIIIVMAVSLFFVNDKIKRLDRSVWSIDQSVADLVNKAYKHKRPRL